MKRLYYLTKNINIAEKVSDRLHEEGITDWNFHVIGKDKANMVRHHLHSTNPLQELDIVRSGERGVLLGFLIGIIVTAILTLFTAVGEAMNLLYQIGVVILFSGFGAWIGGLIGVSSENYKIRRFHSDIEAGFFLIMFDVLPEQYMAVREVMSEFDQVKDAGEDTTVITPFAEPIAH